MEGERALAWVAERSAETRARLADRRFEADRDGLTAALDRPDRIPLVTRRGGALFNFWQDGEHRRGLWRRTDLAGYRAGAPEWEVLLDLDALAASENEDWVWKGAATLPPAHRRAILSLSRGGGDAVVLREYDLDARAFVDPAGGGFALAEAKGGVDWLDADALLLCSALGEGMATDSGYARTVRLWRRGTDPAAAPVLMDTTPDRMAVWAGVERATGRVAFVEQLGFFDSRIWIGGREGPDTLLDLPTDAWASWQGDWLAVRPRTPWSVGGAAHAPDTLLGIALSRFLAGARDFAVLFVPAERRSIQGFSWVAGRLLVSVLDDLRPVFTLRTPPNGPEAGWSAEPVPGLPEIGVVSVWPLDAEEEESDGSLLVSAQDPVTPASLLLVEAGAAAAATPADPAPGALGRPVLLRRAPALFDAAGLRVSRHEAVSPDGTRIPYVQVGPEAQGGNAPVHLSGYGGFAVSSLPYYRGSVGRLWLAEGGTGVVANIRGGGEFGSAWHEAGRREGKSLSHDDFAAVADDLVRRGVTVPGRIAAEGGSNGGLLIANMLTRYPERFGALFCTIPLIDMRRYHRLLAGASWIAEYGDPDLPEDWAFMRRFSAYHAAEAGRRYPPILIATTRRDDRVHPGHARKMAARLRALGHEVLFHEPAAGGHGYGKDNAEVADFAALGAAFLRRAIGWEQA